MRRFSLRRAAQGDGTEQLRAKKLMERRLRDERPALIGEAGETCAAARMRWRAGAGRGENSAIRWQGKARTNKSMSWPGLVLEDLNLGTAAGAKSAADQAALPRTGADYS